MALFIFFASDTWETVQIVEQRDGIDCIVTRHALKWDNFFNYTRKVPYILRDNIKALLPH